MLSFALIRCQGQIPGGSWADQTIVCLDTVTKHQGLYEGKSDRNAQLWVYCNEDSFWWGFCGKSNSPGAILAYEYEAAFSNYWYITFCPPFFDSDRTINLEDKMNELKDYNPEPDAIDSYHGPRMMRPYIFFHETMCVQ